jgi:pimeloyl-ACP methyl ester carboxylesterase
MALTQLEAGRAVAQTQAPATKSEIRRTLPLSSFYDTPSPLPSGKPGELIRAEPFEEYALPAGVSAVRILYHSRSATGEDVAASGVVLFPEEETPPAGGWPILAWAHGSTGVARQCAPSLMRNVYCGPFLSMYVELGYAVVATDYTGLGTKFRNAFSDMKSNATDVINSIPAARAAVPQLGRKWVVMGASEGSMAVAGLAEMENEIRDANYLGGIAISGVVETKDLYERFAQGPHDMLALLAYGIKTVYPEFQVGDMLTEKALPLYRQVEEACGNAVAGPEVSAAEMLKANWEDDKYIKQYFARNTLGQKPAYGPLLVIGGEADPALPPTMTAQVIARMCKQGDRVQFEKYPDPDPGRLTGNSVTAQIAWIRARFAGGLAPVNCP